MGYLLKPISAREFIDMLKGAKQSLDEAARQRSDIRRLRQHFHQSLPQLKESLMTSLLSGNMDQQEALSHAQRYGLDILSPFYLVCMMHIGQETGEDRIGDPELLPFAVMNIAGETLGSYHRCHLFRFGGKTAALLLLDSDTPESFSLAQNHIEETRKTIVHYLSCELYAGISTPCKDIATLPAAARQAISALDQSVLSHGDHALCVTDIERGSNTDLIMDDYQLRQLSNFIKLGEKKRAEDHLLSLMDRCRRGKPSSRAYKTYLMELFMAFVRMVQEMSLDADDYDEDFGELTKAIFRFALPVDEAEAFFLKLLRRQADATGSSKRASGTLLSNAAIGYLRENYERDDLSLEMLCQHLYVSPSYFSAVFKKETRKTFHQVLTELRMDKALQLLSSSGMPTAQVAQAVGLPDPSYFSYCFKKHFGFPPSKARKNQGQGA